MYDSIHIDRDIGREAEGARPAFLSEVLRAHAEREPARLAFRYVLEGGNQTETLSYGQLHERARAVARRLGERVAPGGRVLVLCPPGLDYVVSLFACLHAGVVAVPAFPPHGLRGGGRRLSAILRSARTEVALGSRIVRDLVPKGESHDDPLDRLTWVFADATEADARDAAGWTPPDLRADGLAVLQYTSGSTANPRGVILRHDNLAENCRVIAERLGATGEQHVVSWLPPYHDMGLIGCVLTPVLLGAPTTLMSPLSFLAQPVRWLAAISDYGGRISGGPDFAFSLCARRITDAQCEGLRLDEWRVAFSGAERVHRSTIEAFTERFSRYGFRPDAMRPCYGLAEATLCVSMASGARPPAPVRLDIEALNHNLVREAETDQRAVEVVSCGEPMPGSRIRIVESGTGRALPPGRVGEIWVNGPSVAAGYYMEDKRTRSTFGAELLLSDGHRYLRTGDLGFLRDGELFVVARLKDLIIIRGRNFYPDDIERVASHAHPDLRLGATAAFSIETADDGRLVVVQELRNAEGSDHEAIARAIREAVAREFQLPIHGLVLTSPRIIPRTSSGKIQRHLARTMYRNGEIRGARMDLRGTGAYPRATDRLPEVADEIEAKVQQAMAQHLERRTVHLDEDFFALGGHSLLATRVVSHLRETMEIDLPLRAIFDAPTPRGLAASVRSVQRHLSVPAIPRLPRDAPLPLSYSQERMLFMHLLEPKSVAYNIAGAMQIDGPIDIDALQGAVADLLARHEILRASYRFTVDGVVQTLPLRAAPRVACVDLRRAMNPAAASDQAASAMAASPFDLQRDDLVRLALHHLGPQSYRLALCVHHIVADGWSMDVALQDFIALYVARRDHMPARVAPLDRQYADYAAWQRTFMDSQEVRAQQEYWIERLAGAPALLPLPTDRPRPATQGHVGDLVEIRIPVELVGKLTALGHAQGATLFMVMLAAFNVVLARHSGQRDICVGTPIANRNWRASEGLIGSFVNTLVLRCDSSGDPPFLELVARVREICLGAYENQDVPFERLVEALRPERDRSHSPLFQVFFDFQNIRFPQSAVGELRLAPVPVRRHAAQFDLSFGFLDFGSGMLGSIEYRVDIFDRETVERMGRHLLALLTAAVADPAAPLSRLPMLDAGERHALVHGVNATAAENDAFVYTHEGLYAEDLSRLAVVHQDDGMSYGLLHRRKNQLAHHLRALGVGPDVCVGVLLPRGSSLVVAMLATLQAGGAYIPMDPVYPRARLAWMIEDGKPAVIVTERALATALPACDVPIVLLDADAEGIADHPEFPPATPALTPDHLAYVIFTSGSTGRPKGVMVPHGALTNFLHAMLDAPGCGRDDCLLSVTTVSFDIAALELLLPLMVGATVAVADRDAVVDAQQLAALVERTRPTLMQATPATWRMLVEAGWAGHAGLRVLCGGEALPRDLAAHLHQRADEVWNMYGPTETTIWSALHHLRQGEHDVPIGLPIRNTQLHLLDPEGGIVPLGAVGELYIGGLGVARGYVGSPSLTQERFVPDPFDPSGEGRLYRTGDLARRGSDGLLRFEGRLDRQIKLRGFRIELAEIETQIRAYPPVADAAVCLFEHGDGDGRLVAYVIGRQGDPDLAMLRAHLELHLPAYMVPSRCVVLDEFPRTANGKLDRAALGEPSPGRAAPPTAGEEPRTALEERLVALWRELLGQDTMTIDDDFFDLGGHSLLAVRLFVRIAEQEGVSIPIGVLFEAPTVRTLAARIEDAS